MPRAWVLLVAAGCGFEPGAYGDAGSGGADVAVDVAVDAAPPRSCTLHLGSDHSCSVRTSDRTLWCVGDNSFGQLANNSFGGNTTAIAQIAVGAVASVGVRFFHVCVAADDGTARCWGQNDRGQLGDGTTTGRSQPVTVMNLANVVEIAAARTFNCARRADDSVTCWGDNATGQLGDGTNTDRTTPATTVVNLGGTPRSLALGASHGCAQLASGNATCWGANTEGSLGDGTLTDRNQGAAAPVMPVGQIVAGGYSVGGSIFGAQTCAIRGNGGVACWGSNDFGQLGNGQTSTQSETAPVVVAASGTVVELAMGRYHVCARRDNGSIACWGHSDNGQIGDGMFVDRSTPVDVTLPRPAVHIAAGGYHTCALLDDQSVRCWGANGRGQLADGSTTVRPSPVVASLCAPM